jgi:CRISPR-associated endoribonuclease Cas6
LVAVQFWFALKRDSKDKIKVSFSSDFSLRTMTPILARLQPNERKQPFHFYWSDQYPQELLLRKVSDNIKKKYSKYTGREVEEGVILLHGYPHKTLASHWSFRFEQPYDQSLLNFAVDAGFGERNSLGYGFVVPS